MNKEKINKIIEDKVDNFGELTTKVQLVFKTKYFNFLLNNRYRYFFRR